MEVKTACLNVTSVFFILSGLFFAISSNKIFDIILKKLLDLTPGEVLFDEWRKAVPEMGFDVYFFNWTNPEDFFNKSIKPSFTEIGPFKFSVRPEKRNVTFNPLNDTVSYELFRWYKFKREESVHGLDFNITILNMLSMAAAYRVKDLNFFLKKTISVGLNSLSPIKFTKTVGELLFDGSDDPLISLAQKIPMDVPIPDKFGLFYGQNGSSDGIFNIGTGHGKHKLGMLYSWNWESGTKHLGEACRNVSGAAIDFYTNNTGPKKVEIFNPSFCRKFAIDFAGKSAFRGIEGYKYEGGVSMLDNGSIIPGNECFCEDHCIRYGAFPATVCQGKSNYYFTLPHFFKADPFYASRIEGMRPNSKKHNFHLIVEHTTGILLTMKARLQLNVYVEPIPGISILEDANTALYPIVWIENSLTIPVYGAFVLRILLSIKSIFISIGIILSIIGILIYLLFVFGQTGGKFVVKGNT